MMVLRGVHMLDGVGAAGRSRSRPEGGEAAGVRKDGEKLLD